jgi:BMFP domain-containing protein YqiC
MFNGSMALNDDDEKVIRNIVREELTDLKSEFFEKIDPILKEVTTAREERPLLENRLEALETIHQKGPHSLSQ